MTHPTPSLGVGRYEVALQPYNQQWPALFERERNTLLTVLGAAASHIEHIGSTSVPGMNAKPVLDLLVGGPSIAGLADTMPQLERLGYIRKPKASSPTHIFMAKGPEDARTHYLHMVRYNQREWQRYISFRDFLIQNPQAQREYASLKEDLAKRFPNNRAKYTHGKQAFIEKALQQYGLSDSRPF